MNNRKVIYLSIVVLQLLIILIGGYKFIRAHQDLKPIVIMHNDKIPYEYMGEFELTFYTHTGNVTSTGVYPRAQHTIAVDPSIIPYGTAIYVEGHGVFFAEDSGADIRGHRLDIFTETREEALMNGRKKANVYILEAE